MKKLLLLTVILTLLLGGCAAAQPAAPAAVQTEAPAVLTETPAAEMPAETKTAAAEKITIYAPASTSSIPIILAASQMKNAELTLYTNQAQVNTLFLRGDVDILVTGLSVGVDLYKNGAPVAVANSYVSGLSYLLTYDKKVGSLVELKGQEIYIPFKGSPIEQVTAHLAQQANLNWPDDFKPVYMPFESSIELLKQGKAGAVVLPEPFVSLLESQPKINISLSYFDEWQKAHPEDAGYPQVGALVNPDWAQANAAQIEQFNQAMAAALNSIEKDPAAAAEAVKSNYKFPAPVLLKSLNRTRYHLVSGDEMRQSITAFYTEIGKPLDESYAKFFYLPAK